ncbi:MAG TPA: cytochrome b/b6 domain-containing protein [Bryobacteraceae bacterium]
MAAAESAQLGGLGRQIPDALRAPRHSVVVRVTHWINTLSFLGLLVSGFAIVLAHPRFYWGEAGGLGAPSVLDLPLPFMRGGPSGWGRNLHFLSAWVCVINGSVYILSGILTRHFQKNLLLSKTPLAYNLLQKFTYLVVVFVLLPLMIWTGFAMSPAIVSVFPLLVTSLGGQESARTIHFFAAGGLTLFLLVHIAMVYLAGFKNRVRAMITGRAAGVERT